LLEAVNIVNGEKLCITAKIYHRQNDLRYMVSAGETSVISDDQVGHCSSFYSWFEDDCIPNSYGD